MVPRLATFHRLIVFTVVASAVASLNAAGPPARLVRPLRQLELVTGEQLNVEFLGLDEQGCEFRWHGLTRCRLPLAALRSLANPLGIIDHWDESGDALQFDDSTVWQRTVATPLPAGDLSAWFRLLDAADSNATVRLRLQFQTGDAAQELRLRIRSTGNIEAIPPAAWRPQFSQRLRPPQTGARLAVRWSAERCEVMVDDALHTVYQTGGAQFTGLMLERDADAAVVIDHVGLRQFDAELATRPMPPRDGEDQDAVMLTTGDQLFGRFTEAARSGGITLQGPQGDWSGDWRDIVRIDFARRPLPDHFFAPVHGWCVDLRMTSGASTGDMPESLRAVRFTGNSLLHPWLGQIASPSSRISSITPYGYGEFRWLEPERRHLGDEIRTDLSPTRPVGTAVTGTVAFDAIPTGSTWIVVDVAELEPSGLQTLPTQPFLETLRGGGLRTELLINDRVITDLNRYLSLRPSTSHPERLWLRVPAEAWRVGKNSWALRQRPLSPTQYQYDDGDIGRIGLWIGK